MYVVQARPERAEAPSPGHRPGYNGNQQGALTGRQVCAHKHPQPCIEYVVVHELAHIVSKNHDTQFKAVLDKHLPLWEKYKNELNEFII